MRYTANMLDEAALHLKEAVSLGRTDILKTLLTEVKNTLKSSGQLTGTGNIPLT